VTSNNHGENKLITIAVGKCDEGKRLDVYLTSDDQIPSRSFAQDLITRKLVKINEKNTSKNYQIKEGDKITIQIHPPDVLDVSPESIPIDIIYEDEDLIVVSKPAGMVVHPSHGHTKGTLVNALLYHSDKLSGIGGVQRPGIIHRLDKDTSGLLIVAKNDKSHMELSKQLKKREIKRYYLALVCGSWKTDSGTIDAPIGRGFKDRKKMTIAGKACREAVTHFKVVERFKEYSLLEVRLDTGRTHQIRVHMAYAKHPIVGDPEYGFRKHQNQGLVEEGIDLKRQFLHAYRLEFIHPGSGEKLEFKNDLPVDLQEVLKKLRDGEASK